MEQITVSERRENRTYITYIYNALANEVMRLGGKEELVFDTDRMAIVLHGANGDAVTLLKDKIAEVIAIGYKYHFLTKNLHASLGKEETHVLYSALIAADLEGDKAYVRHKLDRLSECAIDGFYTFRLAPLREKWEKIIGYVPSSFCSRDLQKFCDFMVGESRLKVYVRGNEVFGDNFIPLHRRRLTGREDVKTEIMLSDAGFVYCLGEVEGEVGDFLQKYYAERAIFS